MRVDSLSGSSWADLLNARGNDINVRAGVNGVHVSNLREADADSNNADIGSHNREHPNYYQFDDNNNDSNNNYDNDNDYSINSRNSNNINNYSQSKREYNDHYSRTDNRNGFLTDSHRNSHDSHNDQNHNKNNGNNIVENVRTSKSQVKEGQFGNQYMEDNQTMNTDRQMHQYHNTDRLTHRDNNLNRVIQSDVNFKILDVDGNKENYIDSIVSDMININKSNNKYNDERNIEISDDIRRKEEKEAANRKSKEDIEEEKIKAQNDKEKEELFRLNNEKFLLLTERIQGLESSLLHSKEQLAKEQSANERLQLSSEALTEALNVERDSKASIMCRLESNAEEVRTY